MIRLVHEATSFSAATFDSSLCFSWDVIQRPLYWMSPCALRSWSNVYHLPSNSTLPSFFCAGPKLPSISAAFLNSISAGPGSLFDSHQSPRSKWACADAETAFCFRR